MSAARKEFKSSDIDGTQLVRTAMHEASHAVVSMRVHPYPGCASFYFAHVFLNNHRPGVPLEPFINEAGNECRALGLVEGPSLISLMGKGYYKSLRTCETNDRQGRRELLKSWEDLMVREYKIRMAGYAAEFKLFGPKLSKIDTVYSIHWSIKPDFKNLNDIGACDILCRSYHELTGRAPWKKWTCDTIDLVNDNRKQIEALGNSLLKKHTMTYEECIAVVEAA